MTSAALPSSRSEIAAAICGLGRNFDPDVLRATYELYAPLQQRALKDGVEIQRDVAYGRRHAILQRAKTYLLGFYDCDRAVAIRGLCGGDQCLQSCRLGEELESHL